MLLKECCFTFSMQTRNCFYAEANVATIGQLQTCQILVVCVSLFCASLVVCLGSNGQKHKLNCVFATTVLNARITDT